jgi:hypothetical protein
MLLPNRGRRGDVPMRHLTASAFSLTDAAYAYLGTQNLRRLSLSLLARSP